MEREGLHVRVLGPLEVIMTGRPIVVDTRKALAIVALVAAEGRPFARDELAAMLWPDADDEAARGALRRTLSTLRTAIGEGGLVIERTRVALDPDRASVDLAEIERLGASADLADLERASVLARGPFLAGFALRDSPAFDDWQASRSIRAEQTLADLLGRLSAARLAVGDTAGAVEAARRRVELDPLDEPGQRRLMDLLARSGDRGAAIRQYRSLVAIFDRELGVAPLRETSALYEAIRDDRRDGRRIETVAFAVAAGPSVDAAAPPPDSWRAGVDAATSPPARSPRVDSSPSAASRALAGRDRELAALFGAWQAAQPDGGVAVIEGEAGIGKTRLGEALAEAVRAGGGIVLAARAFPGEGSIPYGPMAELLRSGLAMPDGPGRLRSFDAGARTELARLTELPPSLRVPGRPAFDHVSSRVRLLAAIADALTAFTTAPTPGLIWIDDLHLADDPTREAIVYLARRLVGRPLLLLAAWRREDLATSATAAADELTRLAAASVRLGRLDRAAIARIVRASGRGGIDDAFIDAVTADSEGLPLHIVESLATDDPVGMSVIGGVHAVLHERIGSVGQTAGQVLSAASIIGRSFDLVTVRYTSGRSDEETVEAIEELTRRGIVREVPGGTAGHVRYDFSHGRLRDAAYEATSAARRRLLHARTADALRLDVAGAGRDDLTRLSLVALHEREAGRTAEAAEAYRDAADRAEAVYANREAIEHLEGALALGHPEPGDLHARIGELRARLGEYPAAITALETAAALADAASLPTVEVALGRVHRRRGDLAAAASHLDAALSATGLGDALRVRALVERSVVALRAGDLVGAATMADSSRRAAAAAGDRHGEGVAERLAGLVAQARGDLGAARTALGHSVELAAGDPDPTALIAANAALAITLAAAGDVDDAVGVAAAAIAQSRRIGDRHLEAALENHLADLLHDAGRADASMDHLKRAVALFAEVGDGAPEREPGIWALAAW